MAVVGIRGVKGGSGASLLATNLGIALAAREPCLLIDLHARLGYDDLLLDLTVEKSWQDLLPVAPLFTYSRRGEVPQTAIPSCPRSKFVATQERT